MVIRLIKSYKQYSIKFAFIFSFITALFFSFILYQYAILLSATEEAKSQAELITQAQSVINDMDRFDSRVDQVFYFPRYKTYQAGIYDSSFKPIFTTIDFQIKPTKESYNKEKNFRYLVHKLPEGAYFGSTYLIVSKEFSSSSIYLSIITILLLATCSAFLVFIYLIKEFQKPFIQINESLDRFIKDAMHEINTPLSIMVTNVELFEKKHGENKYLGRIKAASKTLSTIYDDMDYIIKEEQGIFPKDSIDVGELLRARVDYFAEIARMKSITIELNVQSGCCIFINKLRLLRIVDNNVSNAIKYSHENSKIDISVIKNIDFVELIFKDYGVGIKEPDKIFDRYYREEKVKGGFGLGLNIVKNICDDENIKVLVESEYGIGSKFTYCIKSIC